MSWWRWTVMALVVEVCLALIAGRACGLNDDIDPITTEETTP